LGGCSQDAVSKIGQCEIGVIVIEIGLLHLQISEKAAAMSAEDDAQGEADAFLFALWL
jgi:hypothetical protein